MMPSLRALDAITTHVENFRFGCSARKIDYLAEKRFRTGNEVGSHDLQKKSFPRHKTRGSEGVNN